MYLQDINFRISCFFLNDTLAFIEQRNQPVEQLIFMLWGVIIPIISVVGFSGNCLTMIVLFRREIQLTTIFFLRTLVVTDTAIILGVVLNMSVIAVTIRDENQLLFNDAIYPHLFTPLNYIVMSLQMINVWVTVAVAMERYITTCHPLRSMDICTKKNAFICIAVAVVMSVLYNIPRCFATTTARCYDAKYNCFHVIDTDFGNTLFYTQIYLFWMCIILMYIIPLFVLLVTTTLLIRQLIRMRRRRTPSYIQLNSESNMDLEIVLLVLKFILCHTPGLCAHFTFLETNALTRWFIVSKFLFVVNSSVNFIIYIAAWRKFRNVLRKTSPVLIKKPSNEFTEANRYSNDGTERMELRRLTSEPSKLSSGGVLYNSPRDNIILSPEK